MIGSQTSLTTRKMVEEYECTRALVFNYSQALEALDRRKGVSASTRQAIVDRLAVFNIELKQLRTSLNELGVSEPMANDHEPTLL